MKFKEGMQYSTMNSYRSALSATLLPIEGHPVGQHLLVRRLLQGMFNQTSPAPHYQSIWNVGVVIRHIQSQSQLTDLPLKEVSKRLVVLLALSNASKSSDLHALDLRFKQFIPEGVTFRIPGLMKMHEMIWATKGSLLCQIHRRWSPLPSGDTEGLRGKNEQFEGSRSYGACSSTYLILETTQTGVISFNSPIDEKTAKRSWGGYRSV